MIRFKEFDAPEDEARWVAEDIAARASDASECVVLARTTKLLEGAARAIQDVGLLPYLAKKKNEFESAPVRVMVQALRLANARHDREVLRRLCVAWEGLTEHTVEVEDVVAASTLVGGDFLRGWLGTIDESTDTRAIELAARLRTGLLDRLEFPGIVDWFLDQGWATWLRDFGDELQEEVDIWKGLHGQYLREHGLEGATLHAYLQSMDLTSKVAPAPLGAVHCLTVHGSKGLEFKHVYLIGMAQEVLPSYQALKRGPNSREVEEERRNCFVAITRTRETLTLTRARQYNGWSKSRSQFLFEMSNGRE